MTAGLKRQIKKSFNAFGFSYTIEPNSIQTTSIWRKSCHVLPVHSSHSTRYRTVFFRVFLSEFKNMCLCEWWQTQRNNCWNQLLDWHFGNCISIKIILKLFFLADGTTAGLDCVYHRGSDRFSWICYRTSKTDIRFINSPKKLFDLVMLVLNQQELISLKMI